MTELPYQVNKAALIEKIAELIRNKQIEGIRYIRDESDREGMRIALGLKKDQIAGVVINQLYKHTRMENSFGLIFLSIVNNRPELLTLKEMLQHFVLHRKEIILRRTRYDLKKAEARAHILEGLQVALENLEDVVNLIRNSGSPGEAKTRLIDKYGLSEKQAQAILDMRLQRLTGLEREKIIEEYKNVKKDIARFKKTLASERLVLDIVKDELIEIQQQFGDDRRTEIIEETKEINIEDMIVEEDMVVSISSKGYIKRNPITLYRNQRRGGKGKTAMGIKEKDFVDAARALGVNNSRIIVHHILPNCLSPLLVQATLNIASAILSAAALGFLGLGAQPPTPEWGAMLSKGRLYLRVAPHIMIFPGLAIMLTVLAFNLMGDGLRDAMDPRMSRFKVTKGQK